MSQFFVRVTNQNDFTIDDRFDGTHYVFETGKKVSVPFDAACHIFGIEHPEQVKEDKDQLLNFVSRRWGWNTPEIIKDKEHIKRFKNIKMELISYKVVEQGHDEDEDGLPASRAVSAAAEENSDEKPSKMHVHEGEISRPVRGRPAKAKPSEEVSEEIESDEEAA